MAKEITNEFKLHPDETVILSTEKVGYGEGISINRHDLILTNQALYHLTKDLFGKTKEVTRIPLQDINMASGKPQVVKGKIDSVSASLDVYLPYGIEKFKFTFGTDVDEWVDSMIETITGEKVPRKTGFEEIEGMMEFAENVSGTVKGLKKAFGIKSTEKVTCKCASCGASLSGIEDEVVVCPYCGTHIKMVSKSSVTI